jgi:hypothetical protein
MKKTDQNKTMQKAMEKGHLAIVNIFLFMFYFLGVNDFEIEFDLRISDKSFCLLALSHWSSSS